MRSGGALLVTALTLALVVSLVGGVTYAGFTASTANSGNSFSSATVAIEDNDEGVRMLSLSDALPGDMDTSCISLTYTGSLASTVRLYAAVSGALAPYLTLTVMRGTDPDPVFGSCATFSPDETDYTGGGPGVVFAGLLSEFPGTYSSGIVDATAGSPESWTTSESHAYKFVVSLNNDTAARGLSSTVSFTWEARNE